VVSDRCFLQPVRVPLYCPALLPPGRPVRVLRARAESCKERSGSAPSDTISTVEKEPSRCLSRGYAAAFFFTTLLFAEAFFIATGLPSDAFLIAAHRAF